MADMTPITYGADAHTAERMDTPRQDESEHSRRFRLSAASGQRLPHRCPTVDLFPMRELKKISPAKLREYERMPEHTPRPADRPEHPLRWDEECLRYTSQTKINFILGVVRLVGMFGFGMFLLGGGVMSIILIFMSISDNRIGFNDHVMLWKIVSYVGFFCAVAWGGGQILFNALSPTLPPAISLAPCGSLIGVPG